MKKLVAIAAASAAFVMPALAGTTTISFASEDGTTAVLTFDNLTMTATVEGVEGSEHTYTWDDETSTVCGNPTGEGEICATFEGVTGPPAVGNSHAYTSTDGSSGTATVTAVTE